MCIWYCTYARDEFDTVIRVVCSVWYFVGRFSSASSTVLTCDISSTLDQSTLAERAVDDEDGPVTVHIDDAKLVSGDVFSYDDEPLVLDVGPRVSIRR